MQKKNFNAHHMVAGFKSTSKFFFSHATVYGNGATESI